MATIKRFEDLDCWKGAISFVQLIYGLTRSSIAETISHAYVAVDQKYINKQEMETLKKQGDEVWKKVNGMISYLKRTQKTG